MTLSPYNQCQELTKDVLDVPLAVLGVITLHQHKDIISLSSHGIVEGVGRRSTNRSDGPSQDGDFGGVGGESNALPNASSSGNPQLAVEGLDFALNPHRA